MSDYLSSDSEWSLRFLPVEGGIFRRSKQGWNRWIGRIVLVEHAEARIVYTVKIHGEEWTIKSYGPVVGVRQASKPRDVVNVGADPSVSICRLQRLVWS